MVTLFTSLLQTYIETFSNNCRFISCYYIKIAKLITPLTAKEAAQALLNTTQSGTGCALVEPIWFPMPTLAPHSPDRAYNSKRIFFLTWPGGTWCVQVAFDLNLAYILHTGCQKNALWWFPTILLQFILNNSFLFCNNFPAKNEWKVRAKPCMCLSTETVQTPVFPRYVLAGFQDTKT